MLRPFSVGGLIQAAVGLAAGIGGWLTKRSGLARISHRVFLVIGGLRSAMGATGPAASGLAHRRTGDDPGVPARRLAVWSSASSDVVTCGVWFVSAQPAARCNAA